MLLLLLCFVLIAAVALMAMACNQSSIEDENKEAKSFTFIVVDADGEETTFSITSKKRMVGDALMEANLIEGEEGPYGIYVKKVIGITADYDVTGTYWAFYINDEYALTGVDETEVVDGATYSFKVEK